MDSTFKNYKHFAFYTNTQNLPSSMAFLHYVTHK